MIEQDTVRLLRECDAGIEMGVAAIDDVLERTRDERLHRMLSHCKTEHETLKQDARAALGRFGDEGKRPSPMARAMSALKTNAELTLHPTDDAIADVITDGCNMGVKSLSKYLNQYQAADESAKGLCKRLIHLEDQLAHDLRAYL